MVKHKEGTIVSRYRWRDVPNIFMCCNESCETYPSINRQRQETVDGIWYCDNIKPLWMSWLCDDCFTKLVW